MLGARDVPASPVDSGDPTASGLMETPRPKPAMPASAEHEEQQQRLSRPETVGGNTAWRRAAPAGLGIGQRSDIPSSELPGWENPREANPPRAGTTGAARAPRDPGPRPPLSPELQLPLPPRVPGSLRGSAGSPPLADPTAVPAHRGCPEAVPAGGAARPYPLASTPPGQGLARGKAGSLPAAVGGSGHGAEPGGCLRLLEGAGAGAGVGHGAPQQQCCWTGRLVLRGIQCQRWPRQCTEQHRLALVLHSLRPHRPLLQPLCPLRPGQLFPQALQPGSLFLPHLPLWAGGYRLHGAAGDSLGHHPLPLHQVLLGQGGPWLPPLQLPWLLHGLLRAMPTAAGGHYGWGAILGHQPPLLPLHQPLQAPCLGHRRAGVELLLLAGAAAGAGAGPVHASVPWLLVLPHPPARHWRRCLQPALRAAGHPLRAALLHPQHRQRGHALPCLPRPRVGAAAPRQRGGDDGAARGHHDNCHHLLDAPPDFHCPDGPAAPARPGTGAAHRHTGDAADLHPHGHLEPDPGPLGLHPVPPSCAAACVPPAALPALHRLPHPLPAPQAHHQLRPAVAALGTGTGWGDTAIPLSHPRSGSPPPASRGFPHPPELDTQQSVGGHAADCPSPSPIKHSSCSSVPTGGDLGANWGRTHTADNQSNSPSPPVSALMSHSRCPPHLGDVLGRSLERWVGRLAALCPSTQGTDLGAAQGGVGGRMGIPTSPRWGGDEVRM